MKRATVYFGEDLDSFRERESEPSIDFETFLRGLKINGKPSEELITFAGRMLA